MTVRVDTVVIGAGQAGLAISYYLTQQGRSHVVLEKHRVGEAWRSAKWDSFTLVTPNWAIRLPGFAYAGDAPDGFLPRDEVVRYLEEYVRRFNPPLRLGVEVSSVAGADDGFTVATNAGVFACANVVVAAGLLQKPKVPAISAQLPPHLPQWHTSRYRNAQELPPGAVLVVGSGQSGCQIADELCRHGRKVYLCTGRAGRLPRRYRGQEIFRWAEQIGFLDRHVSKLPSPTARFAANPQLSGYNGGQSLDLHKLAAKGVTLLGRLQNVAGSKLLLGGDLRENVAFADAVAADFTRAIDAYIAQTGIQAPPDDEPLSTAGYEAALITELDLDAAGVASIIWATGYTFDFGWVKFPIFDEFGFPVQERGVTAQPGLYFLGLPWLETIKSGLLIGVGDDAAHIAAHIAARA